ncbi:putative glycolipid-binding domain-containing protein [Myroides sp. DW712]|uniref:putative glycolipid-binding domain-containing protein n=1 Tax=Myroides sp. DW712 TaxID=3389800 RepID=UPI00397B3B88
MEKKVTWLGVDAISVEHFSIIEKEGSFHCKGELVGNKNNRIYGVEYQLVVTSNWETRFFDIRCQEGHRFFQLSGHKLSEQWMIDEQEHPHLKDCLDIDITVTPFTNTLPINRLKLEIGETKTIQVLYINPLEGNFTLVHQEYTKLTPDTYQYKNSWSDFEATIQVDEQGLVRDYPGLFKRLSL